MIQLRLRPMQRLGIVSTPGVGRVNCSLRQPKRGHVVRSSGDTPEVSNIKPQEKAVEPAPSLASTGSTIATIAGTGLVLSLGVAALVAFLYVTTGFVYQFKDQLPFTNKNFNPELRAEQKVLAKQRAQQGQVIIYDDVEEDSFP